MVIDDAVLARVVISDDRYLFAKWIRRVAKQREVALTDIRHALGFDRPRWNRIIKDIPGTGQVEIPTREECQMIARFLKFTNIDFMLELAELSRAASLERVEVEVGRDVRERPNRR